MADLTFNFATDALNFACLKRNLARTLSVQNPGATIRRTGLLLSKRY
jgi:hypothetical protein